MFQRNRSKTERGDPYTRDTYYLKGAEGEEERIPNTMSPHFSSKMRGTINIDRCPSLSCPLDSLPPGGQVNRGWHAPRGASCPGISCPPPWLSSPPGGKLSRPVYLAPRPTQVKIYICYFVIFLYHFNEFRSSISHKVRNWCLWG